MATPTTSYDSNTNLSLPAIPDVGSEEVNKALLDIHNALTNIITGVDPQILLNAEAIAALTPDYYSISAAHTTSKTEVIKVTGNCTIDLNASPEENEIVTVILDGATAVTVDGNGNTISGDATFDFIADKESARFLFNGSEWLLWD